MAMYRNFRFNFGLKPTTPFAVTVVIGKILKQDPAHEIIAYMEGAELPVTHEFFTRPNWDMLLSCDADHWFNEDWCEMAPYVVEHDEATGWRYKSVSSLKKAGTPDALLLLDWLEPYLVEQEEPLIELIYEETQWDHVTRWFFNDGKVRQDTKDLGYR